MNILTVATKPEGYFKLLRETAEKWGYNLRVLGWQQEWKGFAWKLELYIEALSKLPKEEPVICVDAYDVVVIGPPDEMLKKFIDLKHRIIFSGQRYFPNQRWIQKLADQVMSNNLANPINKKIKDTKDYSRPCMGLLVGYAGNLLNLFEKLIEIEIKESINDDQTLLNIYYLKYPESIELDDKCVLFQNLWRTRGGLYGKISTQDEKSEVEIFKDKVLNVIRVKNKEYQTIPCFLHAPFNLDMGLLLKELNLDPPNLDFNKGLDYWQYSITHHIKRAIRLYRPKLKILLTGVLIILLMYLIIRNVVN